MPYKVVTKDRKSCLARSGYSRNYFKDETVEAPPRTLGLMTFGLRRQARDFMGGDPGWMIVKVRGIGKGTKPTEIACCASESDLDLFYGVRRVAPWDMMLSNTPPVLGTICYQSIKVLE